MHSKFLFLCCFVWAPTGQYPGLTSSLGLIPGGDHGTIRDARD